MSRRYRRKRGRQQKSPQQREARKPSSQDSRAATSTSASKTNYRPVRQSTAFTWCRHWQDDVRLQDGLTVATSAWSDRPGGFHDPRPPVARRDFDFGIYFDNFWQAGEIMVSPELAGIGLPSVPDDIPKVMVPWIDRQAPRNIEEFERLVDWIIERLTNGTKIEIGCYAAHGRTGTMLACLLIKQGLTAREAIQRVRLDYCLEAIEGVAQERFILLFERRVNGAEGDVGSTPDQLKDLDEQLSDRARRDREDDLDYEEWLRLNTLGNERTVTRYWDNSKDKWVDELPGSPEPKQEWVDAPTTPPLSSSYWDKQETALAERRALLTQSGWSEGAIDDIVTKMRSDFEAEEEALQSIAFKNNRKLIDNELLCVSPPCVFPEGCNLAEGECWKAVSSESVNENWEDFEWD